MERLSLSLAAIQMLLDLKKISGSSETAIIEQAITHYYGQLLGPESLRMRLHSVASARSDTDSSSHQEVLSWLTQAFSKEPTVISAEVPSPADANPISAGKDVLKNRRMELGLTTEELSLQSGLQEETLLELEEGHLIWLSTQEQWALATALDWSLEQLLESVKSH